MTYGMFLNIQFLRYYPYWLSRILQAAEQTVYYVLDVALYASYY